MSKWKLMSIGGLIGLLLVVGLFYISFYAVQNGAEIVLDQKAEELRISYVEETDDPTKELFPKHLCYRPHDTKFFEITCRVYDVNILSLGDCSFRREMLILYITPFPFDAVTRPIAQQKVLLNAFFYIRESTIDDIKNSPCKILEDIVYDRLLWYNNYRIT